MNAVPVGGGEEEGGGGYPSAEFAPETTNDTDGGRPRPTGTDRQRRQQYGRTTSTHAHDPFVPDRRRHFRSEFGTMRERYLRLCGLLCSDRRRTPPPGCKSPCPLYLYITGIPVYECICSSTPCTLYIDEGIKLRAVNPLGIIGSP